jgi:sRNA-binding carbon storage regulator CsrA
MIGDDIEITVGGLPGRRAQLRIEAPPWLKILRKALWISRQQPSPPPPPSAPPVQHGRWG